jgi:hypothetical protein
MIKHMVAATLALIVGVGKGTAHEFWIEPLRFTAALGELVEANLRTGEEFVGSPHSYLPRTFARFDVINGGVAWPVEGRLGDIPAFSADDLPDGLAVIAHQTQPRMITWTEWERFFNFTVHKDLGDIVALQAARGLDQVNVRERFIRYAKSLIGVGSAVGGDARVGFHTEFVALANPYVDDVGSEFPVQLWLLDAPRAHEQVELFERDPDGTVTVTLHRTDAEGIVRLPVRAGHHYMVDAVALEAVEPLEDGDPEWLTHWANLTFAMP